MQVDSSRRRTLPGLEVGMYVFIRLADHVNPWGVGELVSYLPSRGDMCYCIAWHGNQTDKLKGKHLPAWKDSSGRICFKDKKMHASWTCWTQWMKKEQIIYWGTFTNIFNSGRSTKWQVKSTLTRQVDERIVRTAVVPDE